LTVLDVTIGGTEAEVALIDGHVRMTTDVETCLDPQCKSRTEGGGFMSAVVLSYRHPVYLKPGRRNSICSARYKLENDAGVDGTYIEFRDLFDPGVAVFQPAQLTVDGQTRIWTYATDGWIKRYPAEVCDDAVDNDGDAKTDCADEDCSALPHCGEDHFKRGDANDDGKVDIADPVWLVSELIRQGPATQCQDAADANDDGRMDLSDAMYLIDWQFRHQAAPPAPGPFNCGDDVGADALSCDEGSTARCP
jgi:hypothetical protein